MNLSRMAACRGACRGGPGSSSSPAPMRFCDRDLTKIPPETLDQATVRTTMVGGKVVYQAP